MGSKAVIITGSYKENGMTNSLVKSFCTGLQISNPDIDITLFDLNKRNVLFCTGCTSCAQSSGIIGVCRHIDDATLLYDQMLACDILVYATPVYEFGPTALMKRFMGRNIPILKPEATIPVGRNPIRKEKSGVIIVSSGASYPLNVVFGVTKYPVKRLKVLCKLWSCNKIYTLLAGGMEKNELIQQKWQDKAKRLGMRVAEKNKKI